METEKQRERLVELLNEFNTNERLKCPHYGEPTCDGCEYDLVYDCDITAVFSDYLLANGVVVFPHKIGDKIYKNICGEKDTQEYVIVGYYCEDKPKIVHSQFFYNGKTYDHNFYVDDEGEYYYTSRAEAESVLKERKDNAKWKQLC